MCLYVSIDLAWVCVDESVCVSWNDEEYDDAQMKGQGSVCDIMLFFTERGLPEFHSPARSLR